MRRMVLALAVVAAASHAAWAQVPAGGEFRVNTFTPNSQYFPSAAFQKNGDFVVVWSSFQPTSGEVMAQRFNANGTPKGGEFMVNTYTTNFQYMNPVGTPVAMRPDGRFVVVWSSYGNDGNFTGIFGQRFDSNGLRLGGEFQVNTVTTGVAYYGNVAVAPHGTFVVTWAADLSGSDYNVHAQIFDAGGNRIGGEFVVNTYTVGNQTSPRVAMDAAGNFVVAWQDRNARDGAGRGVFAQRFDPVGARLGGEFQVNTYTTGDQYMYSVARAADGRFVVTWDRAGDGSSTGVFGQRFDPAGNRVGAEFLVNANTTSIQAFSSVDMDENANFVVSWQSYFGAAQGYDIQGRRFRNTGAARSGEFKVNTYTSAAQRFAVTASDSVGNFLVTWQSTDQDGSSGGVYAQRYQGLVPNSLVVDTVADGNSDGNTVLEPGESVDVRPAWRNVNGLAQNGITGTLGSLAGPGGPTLPDALATYGNIANGVSQPCIDCYELAVGPTRPAQHWDVSAIETLAPDSQGQEKIWRFHVGNSFTDVPESNGFYRFIETLLHHNVTGGCSATQYCPANSTTREQMAVFVLVAKEGLGYVPPACAPPNIFNDVPETSAFCRWIEELSRRGVVGGCGGGNYCPTAEVSRDQMAVFVLSTLDPNLSPPACTTPMFNDVPASSPFCRWIEELARRGVVTGCGGGNYCPSQPVTREQMGVFISATFGLTLYGP